MTKRIATFLYGALSYLLFFATFLYAIGFIGDFAVPKSMDSAAVSPWPLALMVDLALLLLFSLQHSVMARPGFKRAVAGFLPAQIERSTYVLASSLALALVFWKWQPLGGSIWNVGNAAGQWALYFGYASGLLLVLVASFGINHFDLFGLRQVWRYLRKQPQSAPAFAKPFLYRVVRHPLYVGWLLTFWCTPKMTVAHLFFALALTAYMLIAIRFEERDLMNVHPEYAEYREQVPMLIPGLPRRAATARSKPIAATTD